MTMALRLSEAARRHAEKAVAYYDRVRPGHGDEFYDNLSAVLASIADHPEQYQALNLRYRRAMLDRFPFVVAYHFDGRAVLVVGIMPTRADPALLAKLTTP